ncbi:hypothetical protein MishRS11D_37820 [Methylomagnum ishizawai]|nr:hypothetical protein MishRS11D_37820 [Methylomagnum ishizawai]
MAGGLESGAGAAGTALGGGVGLPGSAWTATGISKAHNKAIRFLRAFTVVLSFGNSITVSGGGGSKRRLPAWPSVVTTSLALARAAGDGDLPGGRRSLHK